MKTQSTLLFALVFALIIAVFAVLNVNPVPVHYVFGQTRIPLILIILGSALLGGLMVGMFGIIRQFQLKRQIHLLEKQLGEHLNTAILQQGISRDDNAEHQVPTNNQTMH